MKLIKLQDKFILVNDEEIKPNEPYVNNGVIFYADAEFDEGNNPNNSNPKVTDHNFKIISENPDFSLLSEEDCKRIGYVDIEKLYYSLFKGGDSPIYPKGKEHKKNFIEGFKTAQSLNKEFSLEDMKKYHNIMCLYGNVEGEEYIQSIQKTEWDVEVEMEDVFTKNKENYVHHTGAKGNYSTHNKQPKITNNSIKITKIL